MVFKTKGITFVFSGIFFGLAMMLVDIAQSKPIETSLVRGVVSGVLFGFFMWVVSFFVEKNSKKLRDKIQLAYPIVCEGAATYAGNGGWLFLTSTTFEFYPHKVNLNTKAFAFWTTDIANVETSFNSITVHTYTSGKLKFVVAQPKDWAKMIFNTVAQARAASVPPTQM